MKKLTYTGSVANGNLTITERDKFLHEVGSIFEGKNVEIVVSKQIKRRTQKQDAYYRVSLLGPITEYMNTHSQITISTEQVPISFCRNSAW